MSDEMAQSLDNIRQILEEGRYQEVIDECRALLFEDPTNTDVLALLRQANAALEGDGEPPAPSAAPARTASGKPPSRERSEGSGDESLEARLAREFGDDADEEDRDSSAGPALGDGDQDRVTALLKEGQTAYDEGKLQQAIDVWSRVYILDLNSTRAQKLIEKARVALEEEQRKWDELLQEANDLLERRDYAGATAQFNKILEGSPSHPDAQDGLERVEQAQRDEVDKADKSRQLLSKAAKLYKEGNSSEAIYTWEKVLELEPDNARARQFIQEARRKIDEPVTGADRFAEAASPRTRAKAGSPAATRPGLISEAAYRDEAPVEVLGPTRSPVAKFLAIAAVATVIVGGALYMVLTNASGDASDEDLEVSEVAGATSTPPPSGAPVEDVVPPTLDAVTFASLDKELHARAGYADARKAFQEGRYDEAATFYKAIQGEVPDNALLAQQIRVSLYNAGVLALRAGDIARAGEAFAGASSLDLGDTVVKRHLEAVERYKGRAADDRLKWYAQLVALRK